MSWTKRGYSDSVIFSLFANSSARSNGILRLLVDEELEELLEHLPDTLEMHRADLDHMPGLLALQDTISATSCHARHI
jgi:hypothetical protein